MSDPTKLTTCRLCGAQPVIEHRPGYFSPWAAKCVNGGSPSHRGNNGQNVGKTRDGVADAWNRRQSNAWATRSKPHYSSAVEPDMRKFCGICGLSEPHECLAGQPGTYRRGEMVISVGTRR